MSNRPLACYDCGLTYGGPGWVETCIPIDDWNAISPTGRHGGLLCITCIAIRLEQAGRKDVPIILGSGPFRHDPEYWWQAGFDAGRDRLDYEFHHGVQEETP